ncbi:MAG: hypothetical protein PHN37_00530 [Candidatus Pacebacteria bacterium]|nr:hypothetical protein [Candidatus Paceibacterota bacterium]
MNNLYLDIGTEAIKSYYNKEYSVIYYKETTLFDKKTALMRELKKFNKPSVILTGSIINSEIKTISFQRDNPGKKISKKEIGSFFKLFSGKHYSILEKKIQGYKVSSFLNYTGRNIEVKILLNNFDENFFKNIFKNIKIVSLAELIIIPEPNCFILDIGGEQSQVFEIEQGILSNIFNIPLGGKFFSEILSKKLNLSLKDARILKENYSKGELTESVSKKISNMFEMKEIEKSFNYFSKPRYILGGGSLLPELKNFLRAKYLWQLKNTENVIKDSIEAQCFSCQLLYGKKIF